MSSSGRRRVREAFDALKSDLLHDDGPRISTMRNYRFALLQYEPADEYEVRRETQRLFQTLEDGGWAPFSIDLQDVLLKRLEAQGAQWVDRVIEMEKRMAKIEPSRGLGYLSSKVARLIEGRDGIAGDCSRRIQAHVERHPDLVDRSLAIIGRAGALYPFLRSSALLRHLDGHTSHVPVVLLYPGERKGPTSLSFMGMLEPDSDYRPRIYP